ncbi:hypothetical protein THARTR1_00674 [Trichoderma harzianum]|uniref:Uncharacterized protein n=1 Tax=Trichoderma harzianum TaxID=5544 RepID=A0A2K0UPU1_TRIHA|nr:hypothetical protein THARTR1_00674 [Trichoderma harzianum]
MSDADTPPCHLLSLQTKDDGGYEIISPTQARHQIKKNSTPRS